MRWQQTEPDDEPRHDFDGGSEVERVGPVPGGTRTGAGFRRLWPGRRFGPWLGLMAVLALAGGVTAQSPVEGAEGEVGPDAVPFEYTAAVAAGEVAVDGVLDEAVWAEADRIALPYETFPGSNDPSPVATDCRVAYDGGALYLGCRASDPAPEAIRAYITDRDQLSGQDMVVLGLSPHDDGRRAFLFNVNPYGVQGDAMYDETQQEADASWDAIWHSAGRVTADGYVVEVGIPFRSLRFPDRPGVQSWSFYVERFWPRQSNVRMQSFYENEGDACRLCQVNRLTGLEGISSGGAVQLTPTVSVARADTRPLDGAGWSPGELSPEAGLDVQWSMTSDVTLNATVNPDFSQVEADVARLEANQRFALFFPERRPFFQEGADLFSTPATLAFTRTIVDPDFGGKATGKVDGNAFGGLVARDNVTSILVPGPFGSSSAFLEREVWTGMATYRRDVTHTSTVGALVTAREGDGYHNRVGSLDAFFRPLPALRVQLQVARSSTDYPDDVPALANQPADELAGSLILASARFDNRTWLVNAGYRRTDAAFRADAGFLPRTGVTQNYGWVSRRWNWSSASLLSEIRLAGGGWYDHTTAEGDLVSRGGWAQVVLRGPWQSQLVVNPNRWTERVGDREFRITQYFFGASVSPWPWLAADLEGSIGDGIDYTSTRPAQRLRLQPAVTLRPGRRLEARLSYAFERLSTEAGERIFDAGIAQARVVYNFSHRAFLRAIVQYRQTDRNPETHTDPVTPVRESALSQLLFSYKVNPRTVLFLGYSDDRQGHTELDGTRTSLTPTGRTFFLKMGYAFRP